MKLGIGIPLTADREYTQFWDSFTLQRKPDYVYIRPPFRGHIDDVRNAIAMQAMKEGCSHLLTLDTDQIYYQTNTIMQLAEAVEGRDVLGTVIHRSQAPFDPLVFRFGKEGLLKVSDEEAYSGKIVEDVLIGCGCVMYDCRVFERIEYPWFEDIARTTPEASNAPGEDINFCYKLVKAGFRIDCDTSIRIGHIFLGVANRAWYEIYKKIKEAQLNSIKEKEK